MFVGVGIVVEQHTGVAVHPSPSGLSSQSIPTSVLRSGKDRPSFAMKPASGQTFSLNVVTSWQQRTEIRHAGAGSEVCGSGMAFTEEITLPVRKATQL